MEGSSHQLVKTGVDPQVGPAAIATLSFLVIIVAGLAEALILRAIDVTLTVPGEYADPGMEPPSIYLLQYFTRRTLPRRKSKVLFNLWLRLDILYHMGTGR